jgi:hypothetical protein
MEHRYLYYIKGLGCQLTVDNGNHYNKISSLFPRTGFRPENMFTCCFPERDVQTIGTRITGFGSPLENIYELVIEINTTKTVKEPVPLIIHLVKHICYRNKVFLFGHSFGGLIVNRICEEITKLLKDKTYMEEKFEKKKLEKYGTQYTTINYKNLFFNFQESLIAASFGSIYIPTRESLGLINLFNYMTIEDIAIRCNFDEIYGWENYKRKLFGSKKVIPDNKDLDRKYICKNNDILFKYNTPDIRDKVVFLNKYQENKPTSIESISCDFNMKKQWMHHEEYNELIKLLLDNLTNNILHLDKNNCHPLIINKYDPIEVVNGEVSLIVGGKLRNKRKTNKKIKRKTNRKTKRTLKIRLF